MHNRWVDFSVEFEDSAIPASLAEFVLAFVCQLNLACSLAWHL